LNPSAKRSLNPAELGLKVAHDGKIDRNEPERIPSVPFTFRTGSRKIVKFWNLHSLSWWGIKIKN